MVRQLFLWVFETSTAESAVVHMKRAEDGMCNGGCPVAGEAGSFDSAEDSENGPYPEVVRVKTWSWASTCLLLLYSYTLSFEEFVFGCLSGRCPSRFPFTKRTLPLHVPFTVPFFLSRNGSAVHGIVILLTDSDRDNAHSFCQLPVHIALTCPEGQSVKFNSSRFDTLRMRTLSVALWFFDHHCNLNITTQQFLRFPV